MVISKKEDASTRRRITGTNDPGQCAVLVKEDPEAREATGNEGDKAGEHDIATIIDHGVGQSKDELKNAASRGQRAIIGQGSDNTVCRRENSNGPGIRLRHKCELVLAVES